MQEPSLRKSRLIITGGLVAALVTTSLGFYLGRTSAPRAAAQPSPAASPLPVPDFSSAPEHRRTLGRADIIELAATTADALVAGKPLPEQVRRAMGRRLELAVPFGCGGTAEQGSLDPLRWRYDDREEALRLHVEPTDWSPTDWGLQENAGIEAIEGYWLARPWTSSSDCPKATNAGRSTGVEPVTLAGQTLAIAQFFTAESKREGQRGGRAFETVQRIPRGELDVAAGFRLVLSGRIDRVPGGGPVRCIQPGGIEQRPICVVAAKFDEARIENLATGEVVATWPILGG